MKLKLLFQFKYALKYPESQIIRITSSLYCFKKVNSM